MGLMAGLREAKKCWKSSAFVIICLQELLPAEQYLLNMIALICPLIHYLSKHGVIIPARDLEKGELRVNQRTAVSHRRLCKSSIEDKNLQGSPAHSGHDKVYPDHLDDPFAAQGSDWVPGLIQFFLVLFHLAEYDGVEGEHEDEREVYENGQKSQPIHLTLFDFLLAPDFLKVFPFLALQRAEGDHGTGDEDGSEPDASTDRDSVSNLQAFPERQYHLFQPVTRQRYQGQLRGDEA